MSKQNAERHSDSKREQEYNAMLKEALSRPGVHEVMEAYDRLREIDQRFKASRDAMKPTTKITTTNHTRMSKGTVQGRI